MHTRYVRNVSMKLFTDPGGLNKLQSAFSTDSSSASEDEAQQKLSLRKRKQAKPATSQKIRSE